MKTHSTEDLWAWAERQARQQIPSKQPPRFTGTVFKSRIMNFLQTALSAEPRTAAPRIPKGNTAVGRGEHSVSRRLK